MKMLRTKQNQSKKTQFKLNFYIINSLSIKNQFLKYSKKVFKVLPHKLDI